MARIHPGHPERLLPCSQQYQEARTLNRLQSGLPDTIAVYHCVHHGRMEGSRQRFGEIDFVLVNQAGDVLLIEQKNGPLTETSAGLTKAYGSKSKNVVSQILTGRTAVMQQLTDVFHGTPPIDVKTLLYCPDHRIEHPGSSGLDPAQIVDATLAPHRKTRAAPRGSGLVREYNAPNQGKTEQSRMNPLPPCSAQNVDDSLPTRGDIARQVRDWASRTLRLEPDLGAAIKQGNETRASMGTEFGPGRRKLNIRPDLDCSAVTLAGVRFNLLKGGGILLSRAENCRVAVVAAMGGMRGVQEYRGRKRDATRRWRRAGDAISGGVRAHFSEVHCDGQLPPVGARAA